MVEQVSHPCLWKDCTAHAGELGLCDKHFRLLYNGNESQRAAAAEKVALAMRARATSPVAITPERLLQICRSASTTRQILKSIIGENKIHVTPVATKEPVPPEQQCRVPDCRQQIFCRGVCKHHYSRWTQCGTNWQGIEKHLLPKKQKKVKPAKPKSRLRFMNRRNGHETNRKYATQRNAG